MIYIRNCYPYSYHLNFISNQTSIKYSKIHQMTKLTISLMLLIVAIKAVDPNCAVPNPDGTCYQCNQGYNSIQGGGCAQADPNCQIIYFSDGSCYQCKTGYTRTGTSNGKCVNASKICQTFASNGNDCTSCYPGYCLSYGDCKAGNSTCKEYDQNCLCTTCWWGPVVNGACQN